jgi:hypothetical protein
MAIDNRGQMVRPDSVRFPRAYARIGGILYLFIIVAALFGEAFVRGTLIVSGDATATANNILGSETLFRVGLAAEMLTCVCDVALAIAAMVALGRADYLNAFEPKQLHAMAYMSLSVHDYGYGASLLFFGFCTLLFGYLIYKSGYLPRTIGVLLVIAGAGYVGYSLAQMLSPALAAKLLFPWLLLPGFFAELGLCLWLIVKGVNLPKWQQRTQA